MVSLIFYVRIMLLTSHIFIDFLDKNGIEHITSPPYCPASNGLAERGVRVIKDLLKKVGKTSSLTFKSRLAQVLMYQRSVPHSQAVPSVVLNKRKYVNARDRIHPSFCNDSLKKTVTKNMVQFEIGDRVLALNMSRGPKWLKSSIVELLGSNVYKVFVPELNLFWKRHLTQLSRIISESSSYEETPHCKQPVNECSDGSIKKIKRFRRPPDRLNYS